MCRAAMKRSLEKIAGFSGGAVVESVPDNIPGSHRPISFMMIKYITREIDLPYN